MIDAAIYLFVGIDSPEQSFFFLFFKAKKKHVVHLADEVNHWKPLAIP